MTDLINIEIAKLEKEKAIRVLYAVESGSRAWGFASTDSDWDIRFIYIHPVDWYLSIDDKKDNIEVMLPGDLDLAGWDLRKALKLFRKSNPPLMEWLRSPIIYKEEPVFTHKLRTLAKEYFDPLACLHHYLHMGEGNFREYLQKPMVRAKKYFYVLRPILACQWIERTNTMPPMEFQKLINSEISNEIIRKEIALLMDRKLKGEELDVEPKNHIIHNFLEERIGYFKNLVKNHKKRSMPDTAQLNELFRETLKGIYTNSLL